MKKFKFYLSVAWRPILTYGIVALLLGALLFLRLESLTPSYAGIEAPTVKHLEQRDLSFGEIIEQPLYLPYNLSIYALEKLHIQGIYMARAISAAMGFIAVLSFYFIIRRWHDLRISLFATILFATSSWFLHVARLATNHASILLILLLIASGAWLNDTKRRGVLPVLLAGLASGFLLYIPGMAWFIVLGLFWQRKRLRKALKAMKRVEILAISLASLIIIAPAIVAVGNHASFILDLLGLPSSMPSLRDIAQNALKSIKELFVTGPAVSAYWVGRMPLLDAFSTAMFVIGLYSYWHRRSLDRVKVLGLGLAISVILNAIGGIDNMILMLPFVYLIIAAGIAFMLQQWFRVFPRNPIARTLGASLITIAVVVSATYNLGHYFIAWAKAPETRDTFSRHL